MDRSKSYSIDGDGGFDMEDINIDKLYSNAKNYKQKTSKKKKAEDNSLDPFDLDSLS